MMTRPLSVSKARALLHEAAKNFTGQDSQENIARLDSAAQTFTWAKVKAANKRDKWKRKRLSDVTGK